MQFRIKHILAVTAYAAISLAAYQNLPELLGAAGAFGTLGVGFTMLGIFVCLFVIFMLRLPVDQRSYIQYFDSGDVRYDGQHWLDFLFPWITGALLVFFGSYLILADIVGQLVPDNWWIALIPTIVVLVGYVPAWRYLRTI